MLYTELENYSSKQKKYPKNYDLRLMTSELKFMNVVQKRIDSDEYIKFPSINQYYSEVMLNYGISNELNDYQLKEKLLECVEGIIFTPGNRKQPSIVHSKDAAAKAVHDNSLLEEETHESRLKTIFQCEKLLGKLL